MPIARLDGAVLDGALTRYEERFDAGKGPEGRSMPQRTATAVGLLTAVLALSGCGLSVPADPDGTLDRVTGSVLHAGATVEDGLVDETDSEVSGPLVALVEEFARAQDAEVEWTVGSEESLVGALERGELDVVVGGFTAETPWADRAGTSRGYPGIQGSAGRELVVLVPLGENRLLLELESFLDKELR